MDEWLFVTKLQWGTEPSGRGGSNFWLIGDLTITYMRHHHTAGADKRIFEKGGLQVRPAIQKARGGGGGGGYSIRPEERGELYI